MPVELIRRVPSDITTFVTNENTQLSECLLIELPHKLCSGTHLCWASAADLRDGLLSGAPQPQPQVQP